LETLHAERNSALARVGALESQLQRHAANTPPSTVPVATQLATAMPPPIVVPFPTPIAVPPATAAVVPARQTLAGTWYYARPPRSNSSRQSYPPEYIEAVIREETGGVVQGRYRARYQVTDKAISPEVVFQFSGPSEADSARLNWLGVGGSRGEVQLKLLTENTLQVAWVANDLGKTQGLGSGTAVLVRRQSP
jgi:hypothetical protein